MENTQLNPVNLGGTKNFNLYFRRHIAPCLRKLESQRKIAISCYFLIYIIATVALLYFCVLETPQKPLIEAFIYGVGFAGFIAEVCFKGPYIRKVKKQLFNTLFGYLGDFQLSDSRPHNMTYFKNIAFFDRFNRLYIDDYITGNYKNMPVEIEELQLKYTTGYGKNRRTYTIFNGLLLTFNQLKKTNATIITRNKRFSYPKNTGKKVVLEDVEYEKIYETGANDQIEARFILTPPFMERLKQLNKENSVIAVCFQNQKVYIAIQKSQNLFEPPFFTSAQNPRAYKTILLQIENILSVIDTLKLDEKPKL